MTAPVPPHCERRWSKSQLASRSSSTDRIKTGITLDAENNNLTDVRRTENEPEKTVEPFVIPYCGKSAYGGADAAELSQAEPDDLLHTDSTELVDAADVLSRLEYSALKGNAKSIACLDI